MIEATQIAILAIGLLAVIPIITMVQTFIIKRLTRSLALETESLKERVWRLGREIESLAHGRADAAPEPGPDRAGPTAAEPARTPPPAAEPAPAAVRATAPAPVPTPPRPAAVPPPLPICAAAFAPRPPPPKAPAAAAPTPPPTPAPAPCPPVPETEPVGRDAEADEEQESAAGVILTRIWRWILFGRERLPEGASIEFAVATTWTIRAGIIFIVACAGYFLQWSISRGFLGPWGRVGLVILAGLAMLGAGLRMMRGKWAALGHGLLGGAIAALYFAMYATGPMYGLLQMPMVFALMTLVTVTAGAVALATGSMLVAILGIVGGYSTPIMLHSSPANLPALYGYLLLLGLGTLGLAHFRRWRLLNYLAFLFTYGIFAASLRDYGRADFPVAMTFLTVFFVVHAAIGYVRSILRGERASVLEVLHTVLNAAVYSGFAYGLVHDACGRPWPALVTLGLAAFFAAHAALFIRLRRADRPILVCFVALAGVYAVLTAPLALERETLTICWALMAFLFLWLGARLRSNLLRHIGYAMYAVVFARTLFLELPGYATQPQAASAAEYWRGLPNRLWTFGTVIGSLFAGFGIHRRLAAGTDPSALGAENETPDLVPEPAGRQMLFWPAMLVLFLFLQFELHAMFAYWLPLRPAALTLVWCGMAAFFFSRYAARREPVMLAFAVMLSLGAALKTFAFDMRVWKLASGWCYAEPSSAAVAAARWLDFGLVLAVMFWFALSCRNSAAPDAIAARRLFGYAGLILLFVYATIEINSLLYWRLPLFREGGISVLWTAFALAFVASGIRMNVRPIRFAGLALFAVVVIKVVLGDLAGMPTQYRILATFAIGVLLLVGSFAYLYASGKFSTPAEKPAAEE